MGSLGLYFGPKVINIVEAKGKKIVNNVSLQTSSLSTAGLEDKVPDEVKLVALLKDELRKNRIESKDAVIALSGADLIIRTFEIPVLPSKELAGAVYFEARKYIPFKIEELVSDFQVMLSRTKRAYLVMFMGIKVDTLERYFSILGQCGIKITSIEYSAFSIMRLMDLCGLREKGVVGLVNFDSREEEDADFTVIDNGFPVFGRDMRFSSRTVEQAKTPEDKGMMLEKLKTEIRISLDYYTHKFPTKKVGKMFLIGNPDSSSVIEGFAQKLDLGFKYIDPSGIGGIPANHTLGLLKAYSSALSPVIKTKVTINILAAWQKIKRVKELTGKSKDITSYLFAGLRIDARVVVIAIVISFAGFIFGSLQKKPLQEELRQMAASMPATAARTSYEELKAMEGKLNAQISLMNNLLKGQTYVTPLLSALSNLTPDGIWLKDLSFGKTDKARLTLNCMAYFNDSNRELETVQAFLKSLQTDQRFTKVFKNISLETIDTVDYKDKKVSSFRIVCQE
ncbi:MAG: pilus assembly protein PilM [Candidatus Omnitrophota bacterium]